MELREIQTFILAAQMKSFAKTAQTLGYSQAAVTIQIKNLEAELGIHLFDRIGKQTVLTHQGEIFYTYARSITRSLVEAKEAISEGENLNGVLTIGTIESICTSILPSILETYHALHPNVKINVTTDSPDILLDRMNKNTIDMVYLLDQSIYNQKWVKAMEEPEDIVFVCSSDHPCARKVLSTGEPLSIEEILPESFILTEKNASYRHVLDHYLSLHNQEITPFLEIASTRFIIEQLYKNAGISFLPEFTVRNAVSAGHLCILPIKNFHMRVWRQILYHKDKWITREMDAFMTLAKETV